MEGIRKKKDIDIIEINNPWGCNIEDDMENFKLNLGEKNKKIEESIIQYNKKKCNSGEIKIDINNYKNNFSSIKIHEFSKNKEKKIPIKGKPDPKKVPSEGLDDGTIDNLYKKRIGILDALKIERQLQDKYFEIFEYNVDLGLYALFKLFMTFGTRREVFYKFMENICKSVNNRGSQINNTQESFNFLSGLVQTSLDSFLRNNK